MRMDNKGIALPIALVVLLFLMIFSMIFVMRTVNESKIASAQLNQAKAFFIADGSGQTGLEGLDTIINTYLQNTVTSTNPSTMISAATNYISTGNGIALLMNYAKNAGVAVLTLNGAQAEYITNGNLGSGTYQYRIILTEKTDPVTVNADTWDFPYNYQLEAMGVSTGQSKKVTLSGDFTVRIQRDNFAKYALFTNNQQTPSGSNVWFTERTNFNGPIHTNDRYNIYGNPSGTFDGLVTQVQQTARFYNGGSSVLMDADQNGTTDVPVFNSGFTRNASPITLSSPTQQQDMIDQADGGTTISSNGVYVPSSGGNLIGGIYVKGDGTISMSVDGSNRPVYTVTQGATTKFITVDSNQTIVQTGAGAPVTYNGKPNGVDGVGTIIYVDGNVTSLSGTVEGNTQITIASKNDIVIANHVKYQNYTPGVGTPGVSGYVPPTAEGETNLLGLVSWTGDVVIGNSAPNNVEVHGSILTKNGIFTVDDYSSGSPRGIATLLGGAITDDYGAFGTFNSATNTQVSGYGRNFVYDTRMQTGSAPPYFPSLNTFIAFTNDITDKVTWQEGG